MRKSIRLLTGVLLLFVFMIFLMGCRKQIKSKNLLSGVVAEKVSGKVLNQTFLDSQFSLSLNLFKESVNESLNENVLISPLSVALALAMTGNGADGVTKSQMEEFLGGGITMDDLNEYLYTYVNSLPSGSNYKLNIANSIWYRDQEERLKVYDSFLQKTVNYYDAELYKSPFDDTTLSDINNWVDKNTDGMIKKILDKIDPDHIMFLINAIVFDAKWNIPYKKDDVNPDKFSDINGDLKEVTMMKSNEIGYIFDDYAKGFIRPYKDEKYSFAALLPNEGVSIYEYINLLTKESLTNTLNNYERTEVTAFTPKFSYSYEIEMSDLLQKLGINDAFDPMSADFSKMGKSSAGNIFIGDVLHKTYISVDEKGTKAAAVTKIGMKETAVDPFSEKIIKLDRPFVYMIIDNQTKLPIFIGVLVTV